MGFFEREEKCDFGEVGVEMREKRKITGKQGN